MRVDQTTKLQQWRAFQTIFSLQAAPVLEFALPNMTGEPVHAILVYMRMISFRRLLLCWMIAWLPISGAMAAAMPFAGNVASIAPSDAAVMDESPAAMPCHDGDAVTSGACDHCELCHLASSMIPPSLAAIEAHAVHGLPVSFPRDDFVSHIPEQPQRPPLSAGA